MKMILLIKNSDYKNVRLIKYINFLASEGFKVSFVGWNRLNEQPKPDEKLESVKYLMTGGGYGSKILPLLYIVWITKVFFYILFNKKARKKIIYAADFDSALPLYFVSKFVKVDYIYDIYDDFSLRYRFPSLIKRGIELLDRKVKASALSVIHVDESRIRTGDKNFSIIRNTPYDFYNGIYKNQNYQKKLAIIGNISDNRGMDSICKFIKNSNDIEFVFAGIIYNQKIVKEFQSLKNVAMYNHMSQQELFKIISNCSGIFSLYDPSLEINRLAASNKLYDAMMLGIPVIANEGIVAADFIRENKIGIVVNYEFDESWNQINELLNNLESVASIGSKGRAIYEKDYEISKILKREFLPIVSKIN